MRLSLSLLLLSCLIASGQTKEADSLLNAYTSAKHDTVKLQLLDGVIELLASDYEAVEKYSHQMEALARAGSESSSGKDKERFLHFYGTALNNLAYVDENKGNDPAAIEKYEQALQTFIEIGDKGGQANVLTNLGFVYKRTGKPLKAIEYYDKGLSIQTEINNRPGMYSALNNLGLAFLMIGDVRKALDANFKAIKIAEGLEDKRRQAKSFNNIAGIYASQNEFALLREYLEKALTLLVDSGDKRGQAFALLNISREMVRDGEFDKAMAYAELTLKLANEMKDQELMASGYSSIASVYKAQRKFTEALKLEKQALEIRRKTSSKANQIYSLNQVGEFLNEMQRYGEAITYFNEALTTSQQIGAPASISQSAKNVSEAYKKMGRADQALRYYELHVQMRDSVANESNRKETFKSQYKYEYEMKARADSIRTESEKEILSAQLGRERSQRYALLAIFVLGITLASFIFYRFRVRQQLKELKLRNQIASDLHDEVGSAISSISLFAGMARMKSGKESEEIVAKIENTSRETVDNMSDIVWSIEPANDGFDSLLKKMAYFGEQLMASLGIGFNLNYEPGIEKVIFGMAKRKNIYLIFKEAINNAAKYSGAREVEVTLKKNEGIYLMMIADNGKGFDVTSSTFGNGVRNMKRRAEEIGGNLEISSGEKGTSIVLTVS